MAACDIRERPNGLKLNQDCAAWHFGEGHTGFKENIRSSLRCQLPFA